MSIVFILKI